MASFASSATTCGARKHAWTKKRERERKLVITMAKHAWRTQAAWANMLPRRSLILEQNPYNIRILQGLWLVQAERWP